MQAYAFHFERAVCLLSLFAYEFCKFDTYTGICPDHMYIGSHISFIVHCWKKSVGLTDAFHVVRCEHVMSS